MKYTDHIEHYKIDAESYDYFNVNAFSIQEHRRRYQTIFNQIKINGSEKILEIGSGGGHALEFLKNSRYFPLDVSTHNLKIIKSKSNKTIFPVSGDVYNLPLEADKFDYVILSEVLEHLDKPENALQEIYRVIKKNGSLIVSVPYKEKLTYQVCIHCNRLTPTNAHLHSFDEKKLEDLVSSIGFEVIKSTKCINKIINRLHVNIILKRLPYRYWKLIDGLFNFITDKPASFMLLCKK